jgi:hypothetical protein
MAFLVKEMSQFILLMNVLNAFVRHLPNVCLKTSSYHSPNFILLDPLCFST